MGVFDYQGRLIPLRQGFGGLTTRNGLKKPFLTQNMAHSKRFVELQKQVDKTKKYTPAEAVDLAKKTANTKFVGSVEVHVRLGIDPKKSDQTVRGMIVFPHNIGKTKRVAAFVSADKEKDAKDAGADIVGGEELINEITTKGVINFDVAVATPDMMPKLAKLARILGPKGLMPNPKTDTVGPNVKKMVEDVKKGKVSFKNDGAGIVHQAIGKTSLENNQIIENLAVLMDAIKRVKPASSKGAFFKKVSLTTTMGPGINIDTGTYSG